MNVAQDFAVIELIAQASPVVKLVMVLLVYLSVMSWYWIFRKWFQIRAARRQTDEFERQFWSGGDLTDLYRQAIHERHRSGAQERIFEAGFREFTKLHGQKSFDPATAIDGVRRAMRATCQREVDDLDAHLAFLASVGSVAPYIGLFGTVWGIMNAFRGLAGMTSVTLAAVAPGIAEALIVTAIGLFAAIPAVVAYNRFAHDTDRLTVRFESFMEEFSNILQRQMK
jgi:biopolymer transport protein TolQ